MFLKKVKFFIITLTVILCFANCSEHSGLTVIFMTEDGIPPKIVNVQFGEKLTEEQIPVLKKDGHIFDGWYDADKKIEAGYTVIRSLVLTPKWKSSNQPICLKKMPIDKNIEYRLTETTVIPQGTTVIISQKGNEGVFIDNRAVKLTPFKMGQYLVTQGLYEYIMSKNPGTHSPTDDYKLLPVNNISWYDAIAFCNEMTKIFMTANDCVYEIEETTVGDFLRNHDVDSEDSECLFESTDPEDLPIKIVTADIRKKGYRLPTEAEWEFAARGGSKNDFMNWSKVYAGSNNISDVAWYNGILHEIGLKQPNSLLLYDMSGNVGEWCWDLFRDDVKTNDSAYMQDGIIVNPQGCDFSIYYDRVVRGLYNDNENETCRVSYRAKAFPRYGNEKIGLRLVRTIAE